MYSCTTSARKVWIEGRLLKIGISEANIWHLGRRTGRPQLSVSAATTKASETFSFAKPMKNYKHNFDIKAKEYDVSVNYGKLDIKVGLVYKRCLVNVYTCRNFDKDPNCMISEIYVEFSSVFFSRRSMSYFVIPFKIRNGKSALNWIKCVEYF